MALWGAQIHPEFRERLPVESAGAVMAIGSGREAEVATSMLLAPNLLAPATLPHLAVGYPTLAAADLAVS